MCWATCAPPAQIDTAPGTSCRHDLWTRSTVLSASAHHRPRSGSCCLGHRVVLADLSPELLTIAREHLAEVDSRTQACVEEILKADACDLTRWTDESFDAALCLGPFFYLPNLADRNRAAAELARVLRPGGMAFVAAGCKEVPDQALHDEEALGNDMLRGFVEAVPLHPVGPIHTRVVANSWSSAHRGVRSVPPRISTRRRVLPPLETPMFAHNAAGARPTMRGLRLLRVSTQPEPRLVWILQCTPSGSVW